MYTDELWKNPVWMATLEPDVERGQIQDEENIVLERSLTWQRFYLGFVLYMDSCDDLVSLHNELQKASSP